MQTELHQTLIRRIEELRDLVAKFATVDIIQMCAIQLRPYSGTRTNDPHLMAPLKQCYYLMGLMLSSPEPTASSEFSEEKWRQCCSLLEEIFNLYALMFFPQEGEDTSVEEWYIHRDVAMPMFLHYFTTTRVYASVEQLIERISGIYVPFDQDIETNLGLSASAILEILAYTENLLQKSLDTVHEAYFIVNHERQLFLSKAKKNNWDTDTIRRELANNSCADAIQKLMISMDQMYSLQYDALKEHFGHEQATIFWKLFTCKRGSVKFTYPTENNLAERQPIFQISPDIALCPVGNMLYYAAQDLLTETLCASPRKGTFLKRRDRFLEQQAEKRLLSFFGSEATFLRGAFERSDAQLEHDLLVVWQRRLFIIEAKAGQIREPLRDPDRAYPRIRDDFRETIEKAYEQAHQIRSRLLDGETIPLYTQDGTPLVVLDPAEIDRIYCVCLTADSFGPLATDLSLLRKKVTDEYPWVVNYFDLDTLLAGFHWRGWGPDKLCDYLDDRLLLYGRLIASDELEVAGVFLQESDLKQLVNSDAEKIVLSVDTSDIFDRIWDEQHGGPKAEMSNELYMNDIRSVLAEYSQQQSEQTNLGVRSNLPFRRKNKVGRNDPCPCASGRKYKHCCGR